MNIVNSNSVIGEEIGIDKSDCPGYLSSSKLCTCVGCLKKKMCFVEKISKDAQCIRFIRYCSTRTPPYGGENTFSTLALEEWSDYLKSRYL